MEPKYNPLLTGFQRVYGAPAFKYEELSTITALSTEIPRTIRYPGMNVYIKDRQMMYFFKGGTDDQDLVPISGELIVVQNKAEWMALEDREKHDGQIVYCKDENEFFVAVHENTGSWTLKYIDLHHIEYIQTKTESTYSKIRNPHVGQLVFVIDQQRLYRFVNKADSINDLHPLQIYSLDSSENIDLSIPEILRFEGMCVWIRNESRYYGFFGGISSANFKPFNDEVFIIQSKGDISQYKHLREGQLVFVKSELELYSISASRQLTYFNKHEIIEIDSRTALGYGQIKNPHVGQIVYVRNEKRYYHFAVNSVGYADLVPLFFRTIETLDSVDNELPEPIREIGQMVFVKNLKNFYYFEGGTKKEDLKPFGNSVVFIDSVNDFAGIEDSITGQLYYCKKEGDYYIVEEHEGIKRLKLFKDFNIFTVEDLSNIEFKDIKTPHVGQLIYDKSLKTYYRFENKAESKSDLTPLCWQTISDVSQISKFLNGQIYTVGTKVHIVSTGKVHRILTQKYQTTISVDQNPDLASTEKTITHNLNSTDIKVRFEIQLNSTWQTVQIPFSITSKNSIKFSFDGVYFGATKIGEIKVTITANDCE